MEFPPPFTEFPTQQNCDPDNPYQAFLWMLVALPYQQGAQLIMPIDYLQMVSKRLWDCGARPSGEQRVKYRPPTGQEPNWMTAPGKWVPMDTPEPEDKPIQRALQALTSQQKAQLLEELTKEQEELP